MFQKKFGKSLNISIRLFLFKKKIVFLLCIYKFIKNQCLINIKNIFNFNKNSQKKKKVIKFEET